MTNKQLETIKKLRRENQVLKAKIREIGQVYKIITKWK